VTEKLVHVFNVPGVSVFCGSYFAGSKAIEPEELRRRLHTVGKAKAEPTICPTCYKLARPKKGRDYP
jgi:hypothetical protein